MSLIKTNRDIVCVLVVGLGRIGLPQALTFAESGITVYGFDRNSEAMAQLKKGITPFFEEGMDGYLKKAIGKNFFPCSSWDALQTYLPEIDAVILTIGTSAPIEKDVINNKQIDFSEYYQLLNQLFSEKNRIKKGIKLIVRTTMPLGGTDLLKKHIEEKFGLVEGQDFYLAFVPERITEGCAINELKTLPKIIGVYSEDAFLPISMLFEYVGSKVIRVKNPITAEFCKLTDNTFRSTLFAYANEIAMHASEFDVNIEEVIAAVNDHYDRNHIPAPGFVSGYCLSKDPYIFELGFSKNKSARDFQSVWFYARKTNDYLMQFIVAKLLKKIENVNECRVAILGLSFKEDVDDFRLSHSFSIMHFLIEAGIKKFNCYDPALDNNKYTVISKEFLPFVLVKSNQLDSDFFSGINAVLICDRHKVLCELNDKILLEALLKNTHKPCVIYDAWDIWNECKSLDNINYESL